MLLLYTLLHDVHQRCDVIRGRFGTSGDEVGMTAADLCAAMSFSLAPCHIDQSSGGDPFAVDHRISKDAARGLVGHGLTRLLRGEDVLDA